MRKIKIKYVQPGWHTCSCSILQFLQAEKRKQVPATNLSHLLRLRYDFYKRIYDRADTFAAPALWFLQSESKKRYLQPGWHSCCLHVAIFAIKKAKTAKDVLDKKATVAGIPSAGTSTPTLQFLRAEKQKQVCVTGLT